MAEYDETSSFASPLGRRVGYGTAQSSSLRSAIPESQPSRHVIHRVLPNDTIQGIAIKYNVTVDELRRANKLYTNDSIFLRATLLVPVRSSSAADDGGSLRMVEEDRGDSGEQAVVSQESPAGKSEKNGNDFLSRMDSSLLTVVSQLKTMASSESLVAAKSGVPDGGGTAVSVGSSASTPTARRSGSLRLMSRGTSTSSITVDLRDTPEPVVRSNSDLKDRMERRQDELFQL